MNVKPTSILADIDPASAASLGIGSYQLALVGRLAAASLLMRRRYEIACQVGHFTSQAAREDACRASEACRELDLLAGVVVEAVCRVPAAPYSYLESAMSAVGPHMQAVYAEAITLLREAEAAWADEALAARRRDEAEFQRRYSGHIG